MYVWTFPLGGFSSVEPVFGTLDCELTVVIGRLDCTLEWEYLGTPKLQQRAPMPPK